MTNTSIIRWSVPKKFLFLFILSYTFFYIFPFPFDAFPQFDFIFDHYENLNDKFVLFNAKHILHIHNLKKLIFSDSGDTTFDFVKFFIFLFLSIITSFVITIADRKRNNYEKLKTYLFIYIRYCIGFYMLVYGFDKVFKSHFPFPGLEKLQQPLGEFTPQGLLWAFMGYSTTYSVYLGIAEVLSGFLLLFRRTTALGALLVLLIMINVTMINFSYDVPVKLFALHLVAYAIILLYPFFNSIFNFFILQKETKLSQQTAPVFPKFIQSYHKMIKAVIIVSFTLLFMNFSITNMRTDGDCAPKPALYGIYTTDLFICSNDTITESERNPNRWKEIVFDSKNTSIVTPGHGSYYYTAKVDTINKKLFLRSNIDTTLTDQFDYSFINDHLTLKDSSIQVTFRKLDVKKFPLLNRGFHWVVEYPFNN